MKWILQTHGIIMQLAAVLHSLCVYADFGILYLLMCFRSTWGLPVYSGNAA